MAGGPASPGCLGLVPRLGRCREHPRIRGCHGGHFGDSGRDNPALSLGHQAASGWRSRAVATEPKVPPLDAARAAFTQRGCNSPSSRATRARRPKVLALIQLSLGPLIHKEHHIDARQISIQLTLAKAAMEIASIIWPVLIRSRTSGALARTSCAAPVSPIGCGGSDKSARNTPMEDPIKPLSA